ncbi:MAG: pseudouridine synthase [Pseudomonadales bacterium]|nr:pseudouridine synthase [Pseudomonadales bacterium]
MTSKNLILFHKPYGVLCQFSGSTPNLGNFIPTKGFYAAGRLDKDSEGLLALTNSGLLQARITEPRHKMSKSYWVEVEGECSTEALNALRSGLRLKDGMTRPLRADVIEAPLPERDPPVRVRKTQPTSWLNITLKEGKNRQIRRMTAHIGHPTLRLFRHQIGPWNIDQLKPGAWSEHAVNLPQQSSRRRRPKQLL